MFFILSKTLVFLVMPLTIVISLLLVSVFSKNNKWKKRTFYISFCMLLFFSNEFIANAVMHSWEVEARPYATLKKYKVGIVLTGATIYGLKPDDRVYFHRGADRVIHTIQLYKLGLIEKILISGGIGRLMPTEEEPEAFKFKKVMLLAGIPEQDIIVEADTRNTAESAVEVKKLLAEFKFQESDCLLITSAFHMRRSILSYKKEGLALDSFSTDFYAHKIEFSFDELFLPQLDAMVKWNKIVKEWVGVAAYKLTGYI
jgi:uncharacterized SAM-binding protein YcdF (DUF218 family)